MTRHACFCSLHKTLLISSAVKKTFFSIVKYVVVQDLVFLLVGRLHWRLPRVNSSILIVDVMVRRSRPKRRFLGKLGKRAQCNFCFM